MEVLYTGCQYFKQFLPPIQQSQKCVQNSSVVDSSRSPLPSMLYKNVSTIIAPVHRPVDQPPWYCMGGGWPYNYKDLEIMKIKHRQILVFHIISDRKKRLGTFPNSIHRVNCQMWHPQKLFAIWFIHVLAILEDVLILWANLSIFSVPKWWLSTSICGNGVLLPVFIYVY